MAATLISADRRLLATDQCDRCGAPAFMVAWFTAGELAFCAHHGRTYSDTLAASALLVIDESDHVLRTDRPEFSPL